MRLLTLVCIRQTKTSKALLYLFYIQLHNLIQKWFKRGYLVTYENVDFSEIHRKNSRTLSKCRQKFYKINRIFYSEADMIYWAPNHSFEMKLVGRYTFGGVLVGLTFISLLVGIDFAVRETNENAAILRDTSSVKTENEPDLAQKWLRLVFK